VSLPKAILFFISITCDSFSFAHGCFSPLLSEFLPFNFLGHLNQDGYARIRKDGKLVFVHREVWIKHNGEIPDKMCICHKCDNPKCINIEHLFLGTHAENMADKKLKGRNSDNKGEKHPCAKLNESQVIDIKKRIALGKDTCYAIAREYGVKGETILHIKNGHSWRHIA